jgi:hypothetical protein
MFCKGGATDAMKMSCGIIPSPKPGLSKIVPPLKSTGKDSSTKGKGDILEMLCMRFCTSLNFAMKSYLSYLTFWASVFLI